MNIAIISDTHDNIANLDKFLIWSKKNSIATIIHCGDIASGETVAFLAGNFSGPAHLAFGNMDEPRLDQIKREAKLFANLNLPGNQGSLVIDGIKIAFCHFPDQAKALALTGRFNLVFFGHSHKPAMETLPNHCQLINPGTLGGVFNKATFAVFDTKTKNLELKILELL